ncbi:Plasma-membrane choline transporter [Geosmithia morbida]|uniref:Protein PNS1 n=1 Tax=Geosmithia morbida TaxID=1094350 RepID=A0A9P4YML2_9HYPO|nr:Plasma-membrane choline transporter [Geosmithia morbida]KAF4119355.1 Plasma-membrane choline transporter [Geosmithia morbida]
MGEADSYSNADRGNSHQKYYQTPPNPPPQQNFAPQPTYRAETGEKQGFEQTFKIDKPRWNDLWAGILFLLFCAGFVAVSGIAIRGYVQNFNISGGGIYDGAASFALNTNTIILFAFVLVVAIVLGYGYVWMARLFPKQFIWVTGILNICWAIGTAIFYLYKRYWSGGIVFLIFGLFVAFCFYTWIPRIPFSALMLRTAIDVSKRFGHVYLVSFIGGFIATAFGAWFSVTLVAIYAKYQPSGANAECSTQGECSKARVIGLIVFVTFTMYWFSEWLKNTIHTTIAGVYGSWYFCPNSFPKSATRGAARRALTYSFGSVALGSLVVAIIQFLRHCCSIARSQAGTDGGVGGMIGYAIFCILGCLIALLEWAVQFFNRYAFCHIALYGKAYVPAAKDTWHMIKDRGIDALVNDCLIGPVLSFGGVFVAYVCALLAYLYLIFTKPAYNTDGGFTPVVLAFSFLIGMQIANIFTTPLSSGIETIFVGMGWDPQVLAHEHPELYQKMVQVYPRVETILHLR